MTFFKYHGNGNDFIVADNRDKKIQLSEDKIRKICHRRFGIGSDGIILIEDMDGFDYKMVFYNPDGSQSFCGNGSRCALHYASELGIINTNTRFHAIDGIHEGRISGEKMEIHMLDVQEVEIGPDYYYLNTGSPHYVQMVKNIDEIDVYSEGMKIRYNERFKKLGTNVNFLEISGKSIRSRIYERGVENETYSSGTGTTAVALSAFLSNGELGTDIQVETKGGLINVQFKKDGDRFTDIWLSGKVEQVFEGEVDL